MKRLKKILIVTAIVVFEILLVRWALSVSVNERAQERLLNSQPPAGFP